MQNNLLIVENAITAFVYGHIPLMVMLKTADLQGVELRQYAAGIAMHDSATGRKLAFLANSDI